MSADLQRVCAVLALASICSCSGVDASRIPPWLQLRVGAQARLDYSTDYDPEHAVLYLTADAARFSVMGRIVVADERQALSGTVVSIENIDPREINGKHVVAIKGDDVSGWVIAEDTLLPIPPVNTQLIVPKTLDHVALSLYSQQEDDDAADGVPVGVTAHVTYEGFEPNPGNPEYVVRVDDGPLAGSTGYVLAQELRSPQTHAFRLVEP